MLRVDTDVGEGFLKALGNPEGPHTLASEWVGTRLADWFGLPTLDYSLIDVVDDIDLPFDEKRKAETGSAFISRAETGLSWGGDPESLKSIANPEDVTRLIGFDTWIRNRDRYSKHGGIVRRNTDNVWFSREGQTGKKVLLKAIDHTHCFTETGAHSQKLADIGNVQDERAYGLFPEFVPLVNSDQITIACDVLAGVVPPDIGGIVESIPQDWQVPAVVRSAWVDFIVRRAHFLSTRLAGILATPAKEGA